MKQIINNHQFTPKNNCLTSNHGTCNGENLLHLWHDGTSRSDRLQSYAKRGEVIYKTWCCYYAN